MEASDISRITYELIRQHDDRLLMKWEDDRGYMMKEITKLKKRIRKDETTTKLLKSEIHKLCESFHEVFEDDKLNAITQKRKMQKTTQPINSNSNQDQHQDQDQNVNLEQNSSLIKNNSPAIQQINRHSNSISTSNSNSNINKVEKNRIPSKVTNKITKNEVSNQLNHIPRSNSSRNRFERELMRGHECQECMRYYRIMEQQGLILSQSNLDGGLCETLRRCSRHKSHWSPPSTPDGFWDLTVHTPEDWKSEKKEKNDSGSNHHKKNKKSH